MVTEDLLCLSFDCMMTDSNQLRRTLNAPKSLETFCHNNAKVVKEVD